MAFTLNDQFHTRRRSEAEARADIERDRLAERRRRLEQHGVKFCREVLDGAFERVYQPDGKYVLVDNRGRAFDPATMQEVA